MCIKMPDIYSTKYIQRRNVLHDATFLDTRTKIDRFYANNVFVHKIKEMKLLHIKRPIIKSSDSFNFQTTNKGSRFFEKMKTISN